MSIKVTGLTKQFGHQKAVNNISFTTKNNGVIGFLGPNGAGKSTTMKMITGYMPPTEGHIEVGGINVIKNPLLTKKKIGYLPEGNPLYYWMYVREYLSFLGDIRKTPDKKKRIEEVILQTGLTEESSKKIGQLSKGYKQRVGIAAAILDDPEVLILDEPTSGLDPNQILEIRALIQSLGSDKTILFSSHILQEVESICERVIIINKGEIVADDNLQHLKSQTTSQSTVVVSFDNEPPNGWYSNFSEIAAVSEKGGIFYMQTSDAEKLKKEVMAYSLQNDITITSLNSQQHSLEDIFKHLTNKNKK